MREKRTKKEIKMNDTQGIIEKIKKFRDERDWMQFHDPKNMAISIILESSEVSKVLTQKGFKVQKSR
ncbi:MAG: hypothetical protein KJ864_05265 [Candidatus Omnitrophica bacterium]|nr:hypothetical protein [Candidatus Omnitrophota bacterium]